jgi:hypothetical protein
MSRVYITDDDRADYARQEKERRAERADRFWSRPTPEEGTIEDEDDVDDRVEIANDEAEDLELTAEDDE